MMVPNRILAAKKQLEATERKVLVEALRKFKGRVTDVSTYLEWPISTTWHKIKKYEVKAESYRDGQSTRGRRKMIECQSCNGKGCSVCEEGKVFLGSQR